MKRISWRTTGPAYGDERDAEALYRRALDLDGREAFKEAEIAYRQVIELAPEHADAHAGLAASIVMQGRYRDAEAAFRRALELAPGDPLLISAVPRCLFYQERYSEAIPLYDELITRFGDQTDIETRLVLADAWSCQGAALHMLGRREDALAVYGSLAATFGDEADPEIRRDVARGLYNAGVVLGELDRSDEAVAVYEDLVRRFGEAPEHPIRAEVAAGMYNRACLLGVLGRAEEELAAYDELIARFAADVDPSVRRAVTHAVRARRRRRPRWGVRPRRIPRPQFRMEFRAPVRMTAPESWAKLRTAGCVADLRSLLAGIDAALPRHTIMFLEGTSMLPAVKALLADRSVEPLRDDLRATIWPRSDRFHIPLTDENLAGVRALAERYATWEICDHITIYDGDRILLSAHDIGDRVLLSGDLSEQTRERFRSASGATS